MRDQRFGEYIKEEQYYIKREGGGKLIEVSLDAVYHF